MWELSNLQLSNVKQMMLPRVISMRYIIVLQPDLKAHSANVRNENEKGPE